MLGVYDSGIGGLSIMNHAVQLEPKLSYLYFLDKEFLPLGVKSLDEIKVRITKVCKYLFNQGCDLVVLACNTASVNSIRYIQQEYLPKFYPDKKVLGVTKPLIEYMEQDFVHLKKEKGLFLATKATCESGFYQKEFRVKGFAQVDEVSMTGIAESIEYNDISKIQQILNKKALTYPGYSYGILACTHYTYIKKDIKHYLGLTNIIDPTEFTANKLIEYLYKHYSSDKFLTNKIQIIDKIIG